MVWKLGIRYLWADTLCIVQDSVSDWEVESGKNGEIYRGSICTIAASGAVNGDEGCFFERDTNLIKQVIIPTPTYGDLLLMRNDDPFALEFSKAALNKRGWTLQEYVLSPRIIHFGTKGVFYTCREIQVSEEFPSGMPDGYLDSKTSYLEEFLVGSNNNKAKGVLSWNSLVENYTSRQLTNGGDKLVAIAGLARRVNLGIDDEYCAGLWRRSLPSGLLWEPSFDGCTRPTNYRAPSWSWASVGGRIFLAYGPPAEKEWESSELVTVVDANILSSIGDIYTQVTEAYICLEVRLLSCWHDKNGLWYQTAAGQTKFRRLRPDCESDIHKEKQCCFYCVPILQEYSLYDLPSAKFALHLLVLASTSKVGTFKRIGKISEESKQPWGEESSLYCSCACFDATTTKDNWDYRETDEGKQYTITII